MSKDNHEIIRAFYDKALTVNADATPEEVLADVLSTDFKSINGQETKDRETLSKQLGFFWQLIPDLKWAPQEMVTEGNKVVVRSVATGSPRGNFMGIECDGSKSFKIDTIDIHEIDNGKIVCVYHLEDWATAMKQLKG